MLVWADLQHKYVFLKSEEDAVHRNASRLHLTKTHKEYSEGSGVFLGSVY